MHFLFFFLSCCSTNKPLHLNKNHQLRSSISPAQQLENYIHKPFGYSYFPQELIAAPRSWVEQTGNLVFWKEHKQLRWSAHTDTYTTISLAYDWENSGRPFCHAWAASRSCWWYCWICRASLAREWMVLNYLGRYIRILMISAILVCVYFHTEYCEHSDIIWEDIHIWNSRLSWLK